MSGHNSKKKGGGEHEEAGESAPLWMISFADLVVLLMSFFVIISVGNTRSVEYDPEFAQIIAAIKKAFGYIPPADSTDPVDLAILHGFIKMQKQRKGPGGGTNDGNAGESRTRVEGVEGRFSEVTTVREGKLLTVGGAIPFDKESSDLTPDSVPILVDIARKIGGHTNVFMVKGHTSRDEEYHLRGSGQNLSFERAKAVFDRLIALGVERESLRVEICWDTEPLKEGTYSEMALAANRRVEVVAPNRWSPTSRASGPTPRREANRCSRDGKRKPRRRHTRKHSRRPRRSNRPQRRPPAATSRIRPRSSPAL